MSADPRIEVVAKAVCQSRHRHHGSNLDYWIYAGEYAREQYRDDATAALAAIDEASIVNTVEELDALPVGSVILDSDADAWQRTRRGWTCTDRAANTQDMPSGGILVILSPVRVIYRGQP